MASRESAPKDFERAMREACGESARLGYYPTIFIGMLDNLGGVGAVKQLLASDKPQPGLTRLWEMKALRLSAEAHVIQEKWAALFTESERAEARKRLEDYEYQPPD